MNRRLQQFLELEQLTPSRFADMLGVQRSGLSHILSGRNNPGYDFIYKFATKFPQVNLDWLITGKGKLYKDSTKENSEPSLFSDIIPNTPPSHINHVENNELIEEKHSLYPPENSIIQSFSANDQQKRSVKRITVFYSDGSFEEFFMSNRL